jgi:hypothetical protein
MATVWRARDEVLGREVAVKILSPPYAADGGFVARFEREARNTARLSHPRLVTVFDCGVVDGTTFIVMELVSGPTLRQVLDRTGMLPPEWAWGGVSQPTPAVADRRPPAEGPGRHRHTRPPLARHAGQKPGRLNRAAAGYKSVTRGHARHSGRSCPRLGARPCRGAPGPSSAPLPPARHRDKAQRPGAPRFHSRTAPSSWGGTPPGQPAWGTAAICPDRAVRARRPCRRSKGLPAGRSPPHRRPPAQSPR